MEFIFEDFLTYEVRVYAHHLLLEAADEMFPLLFSKNNKSQAENCEILHNNEGINDNNRLAAHYCMKNNKALNNLIQNFVFLIKAEDCVGNNPFACGESGEEFSITLLIALIGALRQQDHTDFDPDLFLAYEDFSEITDEEELVDSCEQYNGASMFINFSWNNSLKLDLGGGIDCNTGESFFIPLPAMSIVVIRGDLIHAGSANTSGEIIRKFFLYLDPKPLCRNQGRHLNENGQIVNVNFIYFGLSKKD